MQNNNSNNSSAQQEATTFTAQSVLQLYESLRSGTNRQVKDQANGQILIFLSSPQAWLVANELLAQGRQAEQQFIGAQIIYKKLETQFDDLANDAQILEVRDNLFQMLVRVSTPTDAATQQGPVKLSQRIVVDRICMCIALVSLNTVRSCWMKSIEEIIAFGLENPHKCYLALLILKAISEESETQHFNRQQVSHIEENMRDNLERVLAFICQILSTRTQGQTQGQSQLPTECYLEALSASKAWCRFSTQTFVPNQQFIQQLFHMIESDQQMFGKAISVIKKLLVESKFVKALEHNSETQAFAIIPDVDKQFLQSIIMYCTRQRDYFVTETQKPFNEEDDEDQPFARKFCNLVTVLCSDYELLLIHPSDEATTLFNIMKDCAKSVNQRIAIQSLDFWICFYETITTRIENQQQYEHLFTQFKEVSQLLLIACQKLPNIQYDSIEPEEIAELESLERGVEVGTFRDHVSDVFLKTYFLLMKYYGQEGGNLVFQMVINLLQEGQNDIFKAEVAFFAARSLLDGIDDDNLDPNTLAFFSKLIEYFLNNAVARDSFIIAKSVILFIEDASKLFLGFSQHSTAIVAYLFDIFTRHPKLQKKTLETLREYSIYCKSMFTTEVVTAIHTFFNQNYTSMSLPHAQKLMETLSLVISAIDRNNFATNLAQVTSLPMATLKQANEQTNREDILKSVSMIMASTKAVDDLSTQELSPVLIPLFQDAWPSLSQVLQVRFNDTVLVEACCEYLIRTARALKEQLTPHFTLIQNQLLQTFQASSKNFKCLETVSVLIKLLSSQNPQMQQEISGSLDALCNMIIPKTMKQSLKSGVDDTFSNRVDIDVVTQFAQLLYQVVYLNSEAFLVTSSFDHCITLFGQVISQINQAELLKAVVNVLLIVIQSVTNASPASQQKALAHYNTLVSALMAATAMDRGSSNEIIGKLSQCFVSILAQAEMLGQLEGMRTSLQNSFDLCPMLQPMDQRVRQSFVYVVMTLREEQVKVQLALKTLNWNVTGQSSPNEFLSLEITAKHKEDKLKQAANQQQQNNPNNVINI